MAHLIVLTGKQKGRILKVTTSEYTIGRDDECTIRLSSNRISRMHCVLRRQPDDFLTIEDLGSSNGTFVNGFPIEGERRLEPGDVVQVGPLELKVPGVRTDVDQQPRDDDICDWLAEADTAASTRDTAEVPVILPPKKKTFHSVSEEGADIIRRHLESLKS